MFFLLESNWNFIEIYGNKGYAFGNGIMSYADGTGKDHLRPKAPPGGPLARWYKPQLVLEVKIDSSPHGFARTVFGQPKHAKKAQRSFFRFAREPRKQRSKRAYTSRADEKSEYQVSCRALLQIPEYHAARTTKAKIVRAAAILCWYSPNRSSIISFGRHVGLNLNMCATTHVND